MKVKKYSNPNLKKFIDFYYQTKSLILPSSTYLCEELKMSKSELRTIISYFLDCNYLYKNGNGYCIFETKRNFTKPTKIKKKEIYTVYSSFDYSISFNNFEMETLESNFNIENIEDLIYMLFLFTIEFKVLIHPKIYWKNNTLFFKKECLTYKNNTILYMCEFTQHSDEIDLINVYKVP